MEESVTLPGGPLGTVTGILLILLGIMALVFPGLVFVLLVVFFAVFALIISIELIRTGIANPNETPVYRNMQILLGILGLILAAGIMIAPYFFSVVAKDILAIWAILTGAGNLLAVSGGSNRVERGITILLGFVLMVTGICILLAPGVLTDLILVIIIGVVAIIAGIFSIWFSRAPPEGEKRINRSIYK